MDDAAGPFAMDDVVGLPLADARARLAAAGVAVAAVTETRPPRPAELTGGLRVIRVRPTAGGVDLVVTRERYVPRA